MIQTKVKADLLPEKSFEEKVNDCKAGDSKDFPQYAPMLLVWLCEFRRGLTI